MSITINGTTGISGVDGTAGTPSLQGNDTNTGIVFGTDTVGVSTGGVQRTTVDSSGRLLVGTSTSASAGIAQYARLQVVGNSLNDTTSIFSLQRNEAFGDITSGEELGAIFFADRTGNPFAQIVGACDGTTGAGDYPGRLTFSVTQDGSASPTERLRIDNLGNTTNFCSGQYGLVTKTSSAAGTTNYLILGSRDATSVTSGTTSFAVYSNGNVQNTNGSYTTLSDAKLKENIVDAGSQWNDLKAIQIRHWNFKAETGHETHRQIGPIAQELETVCPGLVFETPDRDEDGNETGEVTKGVNQSVLYMKAVKALQEAMERIEQLEAEMAEVKAQLS